MQWLELATCKEIVTDLVSSITAFTNLLLEGKCHDEVAPIIFSGSLIALTKKSGGIRPIAIGYAWRRLAAKCANTYTVAELADYFGPIPLGVDVPGGCEAAVHATRRFAEHMPDDQVIVKLDFTNAFNSLHRDAMLEAISARVPAIYFATLPKINRQSSNSSHTASCLQKALNKATLSEVCCSATRSIPFSDA